MRRLRFVCAGLIAGASALACSLIDRQSDFFDSNDALITLATAPSTPADLVLTQNYVYYRTSEGVFRVLQDGGAVETITDTASVTHLASDGKHVVVWSDSTGVYARRDDEDAPYFAVDASAQAVAAATQMGAPTRVAYALAAADDNNAEAGRDVVVEFELDGSISGGFLKGSGSLRVVLASSDGHFYFAFANDFAAETDAAYFIGDSGVYECPAAGFQNGYPPDQLLVDVSDGSVSALMIDNAENTVHAYAGTPTCCQPPTGPNTCSDSRAFAADQHTLALHEGSIYQLGQGALIKYSASAVAAAAAFVDGSTLVDAGLNGTYPVVGDKFLFFVTGNNRIQRLTL